MKGIKKTLSVVFIVLIMLIFPVNALGTTISDYYQVFSNSKIDSRLAEVLDKLESDERVCVSVWIKDIDHQEVKNGVEEKLFAKIESGELSKQDIDLVFFDDIEINVKGSTGEQLSYGKIIGNEENESSNNKIQMVIETEREVSSAMYKQNNKTVLNGFLNSLDADDADAPIVIYISKYAPNIDLCLTKSQVNELALSEDVVNIYYYNTGSDSFENEILADLDSSETDTYDTTFYNVTGLSTARDVWSLSGNGMKVGMLGVNGIPDSTAVTTHTMYQTSTDVFSTNTLSTAIAKLMVGDIDGYVGAIPNATLYYDSFSSVSTMKTKVENLLDAGVNAINLSFSISGTYNNYDSFSKWYDHVIIQHNVSLIFSAGNFGATGISSSNMAYNTIAVGYCNNSGVLSTNSSYCNDDELPYKPDIVAPGVGIQVLPNMSMSGTALSAPLVTSAVIQLAQISSVLRTNPILLKSLLLSSSTITSGMSSEPMYSVANSSDIALSRSYGAGLIYVPNAYVAFHDKSYYQTGVLSKYGSSVSFQKYMTKTVGKTIRVCLTWEKLCTVEEPHDFSTVNENQLDTILLKVTTPDGVVYTSAYEYDNKQLVTFVPQANGYYQFEIQRINDSLSTNNKVNYAITWSLQT